MDLIAEQGQESWISSTTQVSFLLQSGAGEAHVAVAWIIENTQSDGSIMNVQHISGSRGSVGGSEDTWTETITALRKLDAASIMGESARSSQQDDGGGTEYPKGAITLQLASTTSVELKRSESGDTQTYRFSVVQWPIASLNAMETMSFSDTALKDQNKFLGDTFSMTANIVVEVIKNLNENLVMTDTSIRAFSRKLDDTLTLTDTTIRVRNFTFIISDTLAMTDTATPLLKRLQTVFETLTLTDSITTPASRSNQTLSDTIGYSNNG